MSRVRRRDRRQIAVVAGGALRPFRHHQRCEYDGFVYCDACAPATSFAPIPWRILRDFDFRPRRSPSAGQRFLASIDAAPIFNLGVINPRLFNRPFVAELRDARVRARAEIEAARRRVSRASRSRARETPSSPSTRELHGVVDGDFDPELFALDVLRDVQKHKISRRRARRSRRRVVRARQTPRARAARWPSNTIVHHDTEFPHPPRTTTTSRAPAVRSVSLRRVTAPRHPNTERDGPERCAVILLTMFRAMRSRARARATRPRWSARTRW